MHLIYRLVTSAKRREAKISFGGNLLLNIFKSYVYDIYNNHKWWCLIQWRQHRSILSSDHSQGNFVSCNHASYTYLAAWFSVSAWRKRPLQNQQVQGSTMMFWDYFSHMTIFFGNLFSHLNGKISFVSQLSCCNK